MDATRKREGQFQDNEGAHRDGETRVKPVRNTAAWRRHDAVTARAAFCHSGPARAGTGCWSVALCTLRWKILSGETFLGRV